MKNSKNFKKLAFDENKIMKRITKLPVSNFCPLANHPTWRCGKFKKGEERFCKHVAGYTNCYRFKKWFWFLVSKSVAEIIQKKKKNQKEKL
jgi:hypothetical protein